MIINSLAYVFTAGSVLYNSGNNGASTIAITAIRTQLPTENAINFRSVSTASSILPAPSNFPTIIATEFPNAINVILNKLMMVLRKLLLVFLKKKKLNLMKELKRLKLNILNELKLCLLRSKLNTKSN